MNYSTHYNLNLAEGTDLVNPLTVDVPNYQTIDSTMFANEQAGVGTATELKSGTIHAITRANQNTDTFKFRATSNFVTGDTFTVDGTVVTALNVNGSSLTGGCFIIGSEVLCTLNGTQLTVVGTYIPIANDVPFDDTNVLYTANNVQSAIENASKATGTEYVPGESVKSKLDKMNTWENIVLPAPTVSADNKTRTYTIDLSDYAYLDVKSMRASSTAQLANHIIAVGDVGRYYFEADGSPFSFAVVVSSSSVLVYTEVSSSDNIGISTLKGIKK